MTHKADTPVGKSPTTWVDRYSAIPGLLITSVVCFLLLGLNISGYRGSESLLAWTQTNKAQVAVGVQVISHILGLIHMQVICNLIRMSFLLRISSKPFTMYLAQFAQAASTPRMTWTLPWRFSLMLLIMLLASFVPAAMWSGAITPLTSERTARRSLSIPTFDVTNASTLWDATALTAVAGAPALYQLVTDKGLFSFDPASVKGGIQQSASDASDVVNVTRKHAKIDKTGFFYIDRSYATGSIAGFGSLDGIQAPYWYRYTETGFRSDVSCFYNETINSTFGYMDVLHEEWGIIAQSHGSLATGVSATFTTYYGITYSDLFAWGPSYANTSKTISLQMITTADSSDDSWTFTQFSNMQCDIKFQPDLFDVYTNMTGKLIHANPLNTTNQTFPHYGDAVLEQVNFWLGQFTFNDGCVGGCQLGRALVINVNRLKNAANDNSDAAVIRGAEDFIVDMIDSIMINLLLTRMIGDAPQPTRDVPVTVGVPAVVFGEFKFILIVVVLNLVIAALYTAEVLRTRAWRDIAPLDLSNVCNLLICAVKGGIELAQISGIPVTRGKPMDSTRLFDTKEPLHDQLKVVLKRGTSHVDLPALVPLVNDNHTLVYPGRRPGHVRLQSHDPYVFHDQDRDNSIQESLELSQIDMGEPLRSLSETPLLQ